MTGHRSPSLRSAPRPVVERLEPRELFAAAPYAGLPAAMRSDAGFTSLFNGTSLAGFSTYVDGKGVNNDPQKVFRAHDGMLRVLGMPQTGTTMPLGYLATNASYANYRLRFEYKWGTTKFAPRNTSGTPRSSGVLLQTAPGNKLWPAAVEVQIQENNTGDLYALGGSGFDTTVASTSATPKRYKPAGTGLSVAGGRVARQQSTSDRLTDWNTVDVIVEGANAVVMLNGVVVNRWSRGRLPGGAALSSGRIAFQAEQAEVWYRNIKIKPTASPAAPAGATRLVDGSNSTAAWKRRDNGGAINWTAAGGELTVKPGGGDIVTRSTYRDFKLHLEFNLPVTADAAAEQDRGNSGVGLGGSYEVQVLDSYNRALSGRNDLGAIYGISDASTNAALPAGAWQAYDVTFKAAVWSGGTKIAPARATVRLNGFLIQDDVAIPNATFTFLPESPTGGPIVLQDHGNKVRYRNVWIAP